MATLLDLTNRVKGEMGLSTGEYTVTIKGGAITAVADYGDTQTGTVKITSAGHGLLTGDKINITGTTDYNTPNQLGTNVTKINDNEFYITETWNVTRTGNWVMLLGTDKIIINDTVITFATTTQTNVENIQVALDLGNGKNGVASLLKDWIDGVFMQTITGSSVTATVSDNVVTIKGARKVTTIDNGLRPSSDAGSTASQFARAIGVSTVSTEDEPPSTSDIYQFIKDGQFDLINKLHESAFIADESGLAGTLLRTIEFTNTSFASKKRIDIGSITHYDGSSDVSVDILRIIDFSYKTAVLSSTDYSEVDVVSRAEKVPFDLLQDIRDGNNAFYKVSNSLPVNKYYSIIGNVIELSQNLSSQTSTQNVKILAVCKPNEGITSECSFSEQLEPALVLYAKAKSYDLLNRSDLSQLYMQNYNQLLQQINVKYMGDTMGKFETERPK